MRFQLLLSKLRAQTYDGASNMMGRKSGVATKIKEIQKNALKTHCHGHSCVLVKFSPKRENLLGELQENIEGDFENEVEKRKPISLDKLCSTKKCYQK